MSFTPKKHEIHTDVRNDTRAPKKNQVVPARFSSEEEADMLAESNMIKTSANSLFAISDYDGAINGYERALAALPAYFNFEIAVLRSNIAIGLLKMEEWQRCIETADKGLEMLDEIPMVSKATHLENESRIIELDNDDEQHNDSNNKSQEAAEARARYNDEDVERIRIKLLLRRAKARTSSGGWAALQSAQDDYKLLDKQASLTPLDRRAVQKALKEIPEKLEEAKTAEMADMMGKLKQLGNGILRPFGLSTDNFNMVKDEKSGGYNMSFSQNP